MQKEEKGQNMFENMTEEEARRQILESVWDLSNTDAIMERSFWVGVYHGMTDEMLDYMSATIVDAISNAWGCGKQNNNVHHITTTNQGDRQIYLTDTV